MRGRGADGSSMCSERIRLAVDASLSWRGREFVVRGIDPMSVADRRVEVEDVDSGERFRIDLAELCGPPAAAA